MSRGSYLGDVLSLGLVIVPWIVAGPIVGRRLLPAASAARAWLAGVTVALAGLVVVTELVGAFGGFRRVPLAVASLVAAAAAVRLARRGATDRPDREVRPPARLDVMIALGASLVTSAQWLAGVADSFRTGILQVESLHYHLPHAAFFVQTGTLWRPHEVSPSSDAAFHPLNVELLHAIAMLGLHSDVLSLVINIGLLWLALLAAWVAGERAGAGAVSVCAVALLCVSLPLGGVAGGTALNDVGVLAFVLTAVALAPSRSADGVPATGQVALCGLALGLALGTKLSTPAVVAGLLAGWLWMWRADGGPRRAGVLVAAVSSTGAFWYLRDWWFFGSPLPGLSLQAGGVGFAKVPTPALDGTEFTVAHYLTKPGVVRHWYVPALHANFGPLWPVVLALPLLGVLSVLRRDRDRVDRLLAAAAVLAFAGYLLTPSGAEGLANQPVLFGSNVRYALPAFALGLICLARDQWVAAHRRIGALVPLALIVVTLSQHAFWPGDRVGDGVLGALAVAVVGGVLWLAARRGPRALGAIVAVLAVAAVVVGRPVERHYLNDRYAGTAGPRDALFATAAGLAGQRIGAVGFPQTYPFYGPSFDSAVAYIGRPGPHHQFTDYTTCQGWLQALAAAHVEDVVVMPKPVGDSYARFAGWTRIGGGVPIMVNQAGWVFRLTGTPDPADCPASGSG